ncbi:MAG: hypothetical protein C3F18_07685 [Nitrosomonadales bacterium]|nr:MAG: hypothetical protein C3F18_07685 [Nitrosomonadales bacterium]
MDNKVTVQETTDRARPLPQPGYLWLSLLAMYLGWLALIPPFQVPDEPAHYFKATTLLLPDYVNGQYGHLSSASAEKLVKLSQFDKIVGNPSGKYDSALFFSIPLYPTAEPFFYASALPYTPLPYVGSGLAYQAAQAAGATLQNAFYSMRLGGLLFVAVILWFAYRNSPAVVLVLSPLMAVPMVVNQVIGISADGYSLAVTVLFLAVVHGTVQGRSLSLMVLPWVVFAFMSVKPVYFPLLLLLPYALFKQGKGLKWAYRLAVVVSLLAGLGLQHFYLTHKTANPASTMEAVFQPDKQFQYILNHPLDYAGTLGRTWAINKEHYKASLFGNVGWLDTPASPRLMMAFQWFMLLHLVFTAGYYLRDRRAVLNATAGAVLVVLPSVLLVFTSMYVFWTPLWGDVIEGVQGRYFLPILMALAALPVIFANREGVVIASERMQLGYYLAMIFVMALALIYAVTQVYPRFYGA